MSSFEAATRGNGKAECTQMSREIADVVAYLRSRGLVTCDRGAALLEKLLSLPRRISPARISVSKAARLLHVSRRTLLRHCRAAGLPEPSHILVLGRILRTVHLLHVTGWSIRRAAPATGWPDQFTFSNTMHRLTGVRPSAAKSLGLISLAESWLEREVAAGSATIQPITEPRCPACGGDVRVGDSSSFPPSQQ